MQEMITLDDVGYAINIVKAICKEVGPGLPGTAQERQRAVMIKKELESHLGAENVTSEEFTVAPGAFLAAYPIGALSMLAAALLNTLVGRSQGIAPWLAACAAAASLALSVFSIWLLISEYMQYNEFIDRFLPKRQSVNVIGTLRRAGTTNVRRLLMVSGHHDSALENTWFALLGYGAFASLPVVIVGYLTMIVLSILQLAGVLAGSASLVRAGTLGWILLAFPVAPCIIFALFFNRGRKGGGTVPGAVDNLAASALAAAMCRFLVQNPACIPEDTEIRFVSFGSEEAGLRGSRRYVARHLDELKRLDARLLNFETVAYPEISILTNDVNGVKNSPIMVSSLAAAAERARVPYKVIPYPTGGGGSDAGYFSQAGLKAATLFPCQFPQQIVAFYHQKRDTPEILNNDALLNVLKLTLEWIRCGGE